MITSVAELVLDAQETRKFAAARRTSRGHVNLAPLGGVFAALRRNPLCIRNLPQNHRAGRTGSGGNIGWLTAPGLVSEQGKSRGLFGL
jgi:hypothetical protein